MPFETTITHNIMKYLNNIDETIAEKVKGEAGCSGRADINGCYYGRSFRIEVKTPDNGNKPSKKQLYNLWEWHRAKAIIMVTYSLHAVEKYFTQEYSWHDGMFLIEEQNRCKSLIVFPQPKISFETLYKVYYRKMDNEDEI